MTVTTISRGTSKEQKRQQRDATVWVVSTGAERPFAVRPVARKRVDYQATHGSLIVLPHEYNETHEHAIPKVKNCGKIRDTLRRFQRRQVLHE